MAELKSLGRQIAQPSAPDISGAGKVYGNIGQAVQGVASTVGEYVQANRKLEESSILAAASNDFEKSWIEFEANPNITAEGFAEFNKSLTAKVNGYASSGPRGLEKSLAASLNALQNDYSNKALKATLTQGQKNEVRDISLSLNEFEDVLARQVNEGDKEGAARTYSQIAGATQALMQRGASAEKVISISDGIETLVVSTELNRKLRNSRSSEERKQLMLKAGEELKTGPQIRGYNASFKEFNRLEKLHKDADNVAPVLLNAYANTSYNNLEVDKNTANAAVAIVAKNLTANYGAVQQPLGETQLYQATPAYPGQVETYDHEETMAADFEDRKPNRYAVQAAVATMEAPQQAPSTLNTMAKAHAIVGAKKSTAFTEMASNYLHSGNGDRANEAVIAITHVIDENPESLDLNDKTSMLYTEFKILKDGGRDDYGKMLEEINRNAQEADGSLEINSARFKALYSDSTKGINNLNKVFEQVTGEDAVDTGSIAALSDFKSIYKSKFLLANGNVNAAIIETNRQMARTHGIDPFTGDRYINYPPSKMLQGQNKAQISNQFILQLVNHSDKNPDFKMADIYQRIKTASDYDRATVNYNKSFAKKLTPGPHRLKGKRQGLTIEQRDDKILVEQKIEGKNYIQGEFFVKPISLTAQNNSGMPVWAAYMRADDGTEWPIYDDKSSYQNTLLIFGKSLQDFAPEYTNDQLDENIAKITQQRLAHEGREIYGFASYIPLTAAKRQKDAYIKDLSNQKRITKNVSKTFGKPGATQ